MEPFIIVAPLHSYGKDEAGRPWEAFACINFSVRCHVCGKQITHGWQRGRYGEVDLQVCDAHVERVAAFPVTITAPVIPYEDGDEPLHTDDVPVCDDMSCPCHGQVSA